MAKKRVVNKCEKRKPKTGGIDTNLPKGEVGQRVIEWIDEPVGESAKKAEADETGEVARSDKADEPLEGAEVAGGEEIVGSDEVDESAKRVEATDSKEPVGCDEVAEDKETMRATESKETIKAEEDTKTDEELSLYGFAQRVHRGFSKTQFHQSYYRVLEEFARGKIKKLIISVPPQHGKSLGSSVMLPAYVLGLKPNTKIALTSYSSVLASRFNRRVQRVIEREEYAELFPKTTIKAVSAKSNYVRTASHVEIIDHVGELYSIGREGSLTGNEVDLFILDDLYKDAMEANSPVIRDNCWEWYTSVVKTRMHNDSQELIVFTRWHEEDLIGSVLSREPHTLLERWEQIEQHDPSHWLVVNFEAIKEGKSTEVDPRERGEVLWKERHNSKLLKQKRALDAFRFNCMYQGRPTMHDGLLYGKNIRTYTTPPKRVLRKGNYTDTADLGEDYLCSVCYDVGDDGFIYITDIVYSQERMEVTEQLVADLLRETETRYACIESNNGGRGFARAVGRLAPSVRIEWFHQSDNKEARILSNSATVLRNVILPEDWAVRWGDFYNHIVNYRRLYRANRLHDAADVLTGIVEKEIVNDMSKKIMRFGV